MDQMEKNPEQDFLCLDEAGVEAVRRQMPDEDDLYDLAELYKVFGDSPASKFCMCCSVRSCACMTLQGSWA